MCADQHQLPYWQDDESLDPEIFFKLLVKWYAGRDLTEAECKEGVTLVRETFGISQLPGVTGAIASVVRGKGPNEPNLRLAKASRDGGSMSQTDFEKFSKKQWLRTRQDNFAACRGALLNWIQNYCLEFTQKKTKGPLVTDSMDEWLKRVFALKS